MYHSDLIINGIQAEKLIALKLEKALSGVKSLTLKQVEKMGNSATRLLFYTSCLTENYQDVCARLKEEDVRFLDGLVQLVNNRDVIFRIIHIYFEDIFKLKERQQIEFIKMKLIKAGVNISASSMTNQAFVLGVTTSVCLGVGFNSFMMEWTGKVATFGVIGLSLYGYVQQAADSAERLKRIAPGYYSLLYISKLEMMYFLVESAFDKAQAFRQNFMSDSAVTNTIINLVK